MYWYTGWVLSKVDLQISGWSIGNPTTEAMSPWQYIICEVHCSLQALVHTALWVSQPMMLFLLAYGCGN